MSEIRDAGRWSSDAEMILEMEALKKKVHAPIDEMVAFTEFMRAANIESDTLERCRSELNDHLLAIAKIIDPAAFMPSARDDDTFSVNAALDKARRIVELVG